LTGLFKRWSDSKDCPEGLQTEAYKPMYEKDGRIKYFIKLLEKKGFIVQEGSLQYIDILKLVSEGKSSTALGNIVGAPICNLSSSSGTKSNAITRAETAKRL
jgi:hypothetical protein